jgi:hypothetical protein
MTAYGEIRAIARSFDGDFMVKIGPQTPYCCRSR